VDLACLIVAGIVRATLPGPEFTLAWTHSVEQTRWEETYRIDGDRLVLAEARVEGSGAGMEPPPGAQLRDGRWTWQPRSAHSELRLTESTFTKDYTLCANGGCADLGDRVGTTADGEIVTVRACEIGTSAGTPTGTSDGISAGREQIRR
jgi:hypothetical protein